MKVNMFPAASFAFLLLSLASCPIPLDNPGGPKVSPPPAPEGFTARVKTTTSADLSWTAVSDAASYSVYRAAAAEGPFQRIAVITDAATAVYSDTALIANTAYWYGVSVAKNNEGESPRSGMVSVYTGTPEVPVNLKVEVLSSTSIKLEWDASIGAEWYGVYRSSPLEGEYTQIGTVTQAGYIDSTVTLNNDYFYKVSAANGLGESAQSAPVQGSTKAPPAPTGLEAGAINASSIQILWSPSARADSYRIYRANSSAGSYNLIGESATTSYTDSGLSTGNIYYYKVSAVNVIGEGLPSEYVQGQISVPPAPANVTVTPLSDSSLQVTWDPVPGAEMYMVYQTYAYPSSQTAVPGTSFTDTGLDSFKRYDYQVSAVNGIGEGPKSKEVSAYTRPIPLTEGVWYSHTKSTSYSYYDYFSFPVSGGTYYVQWGNVGHTAEVSYKVSAYWNSTNSMTSLSYSFFVDQTNGLAAPRSISAPSTGYIILKIDGSYYDIRWYRE